MRIHSPLLFFIWCICYIAFANGLQIPHLKTLLKNGTEALPVVIWHGMGDTCCDSHSIGSIKNLIEKQLGVFVYSIQTGNTPNKDLIGGYFGNVNDQVARACEAIRNIPELQNGYNGLGFSQGGQFLRAVVQRCQQTGPSMRTLITFGAQHQGVMSVPGCAFNASGPCKTVQKLLSYGAYLPWIHDHVVQAQYFKDPYRLDSYRKNNVFLADINNDVEGANAKNPLYGRNLATLEKLVLFKFSQDQMVAPPESSWFSFYNGTTIVPLREQALYTEDWIGLRTLDELGRLEMDVIAGGHMEIKLKWFSDVIIPKYLTAKAV
mmetsp:Transcript_33418/g.60379  ORF Transcript_33418/g.60379 Transcript_33418/m.60379 type:complete len:320 (-) Transcript_33418:239-1198(-)